jgi:hypothetical protein
MTLHEATGDRSTGFVELGSAMAENGQNKNWTWKLIYAYFHEMRFSIGLYCTIFLLKLLQWRWNGDGRTWIEYGRPRWLQNNRQIYIILASLYYFEVTKTGSIAEFFFCEFYVVKIDDWNRIFMLCSWELRECKVDVSRALPHFVKNDHGRPGWLRNNRQILHNFSEPLLLWSHPDRCKSCL